MIDPLKPETEAFIADPYPTLHQMRQHAAIWWSEQGRHWLVTGYQQGQSVLRDRRFLKGMRVWRYLEKIGQVPKEWEAFIKARSKWMVHLDPPDHTRMRTLVNKAFAPSMVSALSEHAAGSADLFWDKFSDTRQAELMSDIAGPYVLKILCHLLGIPEVDQPQFSLWAQTVTRRINAGKDLQDDHEHVKLLREYLVKFVQECQSAPKPGAISLLAQPAADSERLGAEEILDNCYLLLVAGYETSANAIGNSIATLQRHPDQLALLMSSPSLLRSAVDEILRFESPVQTLSEIAAEDMTIDGAEMKKGQNVIVMLGACNRDPQQFKDPDTFDITRRDGKNLAFGEGIHHCLGSSVAELLIGTFLKKMLMRAPHLSLLQPQVKFRRPFGLRGPERLDARW